MLLEELEEEKGMSEDHSLEEICPLVSKDESETNEDETEKNCTNERKSIGCVLDTCFCATLQADLLKLTK